MKYEFKKKFEAFKTSISEYETTQLENFRKEKERRVASLSSSDKKILQIFTEQFDESKSISVRDTLLSFLYLSRSVKYKIVSLKYIDCLNNKCVIDDQNETIQNRVAEKEKQLERKYGETFSLWYPKLKDEKLLKKTNKSGECGDFFPNLTEISFDENIWNDFESFMISYNSETSEMELQNQKAENQFANNIALTKSQLRNNVIDYFEGKLSDRKYQIISSQPETKTYNSSVLGVITYNLNRTIFDKESFQNVADDAFEEQWKYNSLYTGAMPYASCYGSSNYCSDWSCSKVKVITGGSGDVLVTIKNSDGTVVRHAYIKGGYSYQFDIPDGSYQVFFYSGSGWNPNKEMPSTSCNSLRGGFVMNESVTKDNYINLYSQIMTYELILQQDGNFNTKPSSKNEAF